MTKQKKLLSPEEESMLHFANLLCSKICHDIVGPLGAVHNGFELLEDATESDERRNIENTMHNSCNSALSKLKFERLALGSGGSGSSDLSMEDILELCNDYFNQDKKRLNFKTELKSLSKKYFRVLLNILMLMPNFAPRCGLMQIYIGGGSTPFFKVSAQSSYARLGEQAVLLLERKETIVSENLHPRNIHLFYTGLLAAHSGMKITIRQQQDVIHVLVE